jgi:hypothetical protein
MGKFTKIKATAENGATCTIQQTLPYGTAGGAKNCSQKQIDAYNLARMQADSRNGGDMEKAKATLEAAGWNVFWV